MTPLIRVILISTQFGFAAGFSDTSGYWAEASIEKYSGAGILYGYPDGSFRPDDICI